MSINIEPGSDYGYTADGDTIDALTNALDKHAKAAKSIASAAQSAEVLSKVQAITALSDLLNSGAAFTTEQRDNMELKLNELVAAL